MTVRVEYGTDIYTGVTLTFLREEDGVVQDVPIVAPGPQWNYIWSQTTHGTYLVKAKVDNSGGCSGFLGVRAERDPQGQNGRQYRFHRARERCGCRGRVAMRNHCRHGYVLHRLS